jgi:Tfp pilus assembly protein PilV
MQAIALHNRQRGTTLVEIVVSCVILAVLAIAGMTALCETGAGLAIQKNRRIALGIANSRLEELRTVPYIALTALISKNYNTNAIGKVSGQFALLPSETVSIGGKPMSHDHHDPIRRCRWGHLNLRLFADDDFGAISWSE